MLELVSPYDKGGVIGGQPEPNIFGFRRGHSCS